MKRRADSTVEERKKAKLTSQGDAAAARSACEQREHGRDIAAQLASEAQHARNGWNATQWASGDHIDEALADQYKKMLEKALQPIGQDECWRLLGNSLLTKEEVLVHYPTAAGVFQHKVADLEAFEKAKQCVARKREGTRDNELAVFNFKSTTMYDQETGELFTVELGDYVEVTEFKDPGEFYHRHPVKELKLDGSKASKIGKHTFPTIGRHEMTVEGRKVVVEDGKVVQLNGRKVHFDEQTQKMVIEHDHIMRVTEIFYSASGDYMFKGLWFYEDIDTAIAALPKEHKKYGGIPELPSGDHLGHPRQLWLCGSEEDNETYQNTYHIGVISKKLTVHQIPPQLTSPPQDVKFDATKDWFYNSFTVRSFITMEDLWEDWMPWSPKYKQLLEQEGLQGIVNLRNSCNGNFTQLMRGASRQKLGHAERQVLPVLELFAGGGGISHIARSSDKVQIMHGWANDNNQSACATYNCNVPEAHVFCQGLEELLQLFIKWNSEVERYLGNEWRQKLASILQGGPQKKYSRRHVPKGVACWGTTMGKEGSSADVFLTAAARGDEAVRAAGLEDDDSEADAPDWDALISTLSDVIPDSDCSLPSKPAVEGSEAEQKAVLKACETAIAVQKQRISECKQLVEDLDLGQVVEVRDVRITDCAVRVKHGSSRNQLDEGLTDFECWLEYEVQRQGSPQWRWEHQSLLCDKEALLPMRRFMLRMLADKTIPMPGDVGLLTGGPPCQNVSGLNRQAPQKEILTDPKNRLVTSYVRITEFLKPRYLLMEQVCDVFKKAGGLYARYALQQMVQMGYQCRAGICTAGNYGCPQGRRRAVFWGALSGKEQLPAFPAPTHACRDFNMPFPTQAACCAVDTPADQRKYKMVVLGDVLTDLPEVSNFEESDRASYSGPPKFVTQEFLRRFPPEHGRSLLARCVFADAAMAPWQKLQQVADDALAGPDHDQVIAILGAGAQILCKNKGTEGSSHKEKSKHKPTSKSTTAVTPAAAAAAADKADGSDDDDEDEEPQQEAAALVDEDDLDENAAEEAKELASAISEQKNFARQTWLSHLHDLTKDAEVRSVMNLMQDNEVLSTTWLLGKHRLSLVSRAVKVAANAHLRDHRPLLCNADDYGRMCAVPKQKGANFRNMPGVVTHTDSTNCVGSWHCITKARLQQHKEIEQRIQQWNKLSPQEQANYPDPKEFVYKDIEMQSACSAGGMPPKPPKGLNLKSGNDKSNRVDHYGSTAQGAWRGTHKDGCASYAYWMATGDLVCPRWCCTYKCGICNGRHGCFGRVWYDDIQPTVVTRAEPHNLQLIHPTQDRVLSIRENARCQGFPDYHVFIGLGKSRGGSHGKGAATVDERYMQIGNAVSPLLSANLGECLLLAVAEESPIGEGAIKVQLQEYEKAYEACKEEGIGFWCEQPGNVVEQGKGNEYYWRLHNPEGRKKSKGAQSIAPAAGAKTDQQQAPDGSEVAAGNNAAAARSRPSSGKAAAVSGPSSGKAAAGHFGPGSSKAAAKAQSRTHTSATKCTTIQSRETTESAAAATAAGALCGDNAATAAASSGAAKSSQQKRKLSEAAAEHSAVERTADAPADTKRSRSSVSAAAGKSGGRSGGSGCSRPQRVAAAAAQQATRDQLELENTRLDKHCEKVHELQQRNTPKRDTAADQSALAVAADAGAAGEPCKLQLAARELAAVEPEEPALMAAAAAAEASDVDSDGTEQVVDPNSNRSSADVVLPTGAGIAGHLGDVLAAAV